MTSAPPARAAQKTGTARAVRGWTALLAALGAALAALVAAGWAPLRELDRRTARELHELALAHPGWTRAARVCTDWVWDPWTMRTLLAVAVLWLWWRARRELALRLAVAGLCGAALQQALKAALDRERPVWADPVDSAHYAAMPSGHAMTASMTCALLLWALHRCAVPRAAWWAAAAAAALSVPGVSFTRVYLGVHWLTDVLVGVLLGAAVAGCAAGGIGGRRRTGRIGE